MALCLALPGDQLQLGQKYFAQITTERAGQTERPGRAIQIGFEMAQIVAIGVRHFALESAQVYIGLGNQRVQGVPRKLKPVDSGVGLQAFLPIHLPGQFQTLLGADG